MAEVRTGRERGGGGMEVGKRERDETAVISAPTVNVDDTAARLRNGYERGRSQTFRKLSSSILILAK